MTSRSVASGPLASVWQAHQPAMFNATATTPAAQHFPTMSALMKAFVSGSRDIVARQMIANDDSAKRSGCLTPAKQTLSSRFTLANEAIMQRTAPFSAILISLVFGSLAGAQDTASLLARIKAVGKEGTGNVEAAKAWKELVKLGPAALPDVLAGLDNSSPTA